jgi:hypothetical protein
MKEDLKERVMIHYWTLGEAKGNKKNSLIRAVAKNAKKGNIANK